MTTDGFAVFAAELSRRVSKVFEVQDTLMAMLGEGQHVPGSVVP